MKPLASDARSLLRRLGDVAAIGLAVTTVLGPNLRAQTDLTAEHYVGTWATALVSSQEPAPAFRMPPPERPQLPPTLEAVTNQTLRQIVHTSIGGTRLRVVFANTFGTRPLTVSAAYIALRSTGAAIVPKSGRPLVFSGKESTTIPVGAVTFSDPVDLPVQAFADLAIDLHVPGDTTGSPLTMHTFALQTNYVSEGNHVGETEVPVKMTVRSWYFLARIEVVAPASVGAVVTLGDSITDGGPASTVDVNHRWPDDLARRLASEAGRTMAVLNLGIGGNRLLSDRRGVNALARFDRDVGAQTGATHLVLLEGINDIGYAGDDPSPTATDLISAHQQLIARAHARGLKIYGATLTPFEGAFYQTAVGETKRQALNTWIRMSGAYDGVIDFDRAVRDPTQPTKALAAYDPGDHLHFIDAGHQAMAAAIDLSLLKRNLVGATLSR